MKAVPFCSQNRYTFTSEGWSNDASKRASLTKLRRPSSKVSRWRSERSETPWSAPRVASELGMYSLSATVRCNCRSLAR